MGTINLFLNNPVGVFFATILFITLLLETSTLLKRHLRIGELRHAIDLIHDRNGNSDAVKLYGECVHLSRVYFIPLSRVCFRGGKRALMNEAFKSQRRADDRKELVLKGAALPKPNSGLGQIVIG